MPVALAGQAVSFAVSGPDHRPAAGVVVYLPDVHAPLVRATAVVDQRDEAFVPGNFRRARGQ